ncbi:uncharacterized protein LOC144142795 isoform X3 [Haemaphysalis longicornis]
MAGPPQEAVESFEVNIDLGDFQLDCRAYFKDPDKIIRCINCGSSPDGIYSMDSNYGFCRSCFFGPSAYSSSGGTIHTHQMAPFVRYNTALLDAVIECPGCGQRCKYEGLKTHFKLSHPELFKRGRQHRPSEVQQRNGVAPVLGSQSRQQAVQNLKEEPVNKELLRSAIAPPEAVTTQQPSDCEMEQYKNTPPCLQKCEKWFKEQILTYYYENIKDFSPSEVEGVINSQGHLDACPTVSSMFKEWYGKAYPKYEEHKNYKCSGCIKRRVSFEELTENCKNFLSDLQAMATEGMFEYYQQHAKGCPGSNAGTRCTQATEPNTIRPPPGFPGHVSPIGREPVKTSLQYPGAKVGEGTEPPVANAECPNCLEEWSCEEIGEADKDSEEWSRETEVAALRKRVKELEERLENLELPIKELLRKLRHQE